MGEVTKIAWCDHTFNPWLGCQKVAPECTHCYANEMAHRWGWDCFGSSPRKRTSEANWHKPFAWNKAAREVGVRRRVFCGSLCDVFEDAPGLAAMRADAFRVIEACDSLDWLLLTKRPENINAMLPAYLARAAHVHVGTTAGCQRTAESNVPALLAAGCAGRRFVSCEPLLGPLQLDVLDAGAFASLNALTGEKSYAGRGGTGGHTSSLYSGLDWVIAGSESGTQARPMSEAWVRALRDQCQAAGVPFFYKQRLDGRGRKIELPEIDGRTWRETPWGTR